MRLSSIEARRLTLSSRVVQVIERDTHEHHRIKVSSAHCDIEHCVYGPWC